MKLYHEEPREENDPAKKNQNIQRGRKETTALWDSTSQRRRIPRRRVREAAET